MPLWIADSGYYFAALAAFKALANLDFLLAAVFLWSKFFAAALSIAFTATFTESAADALPSAIASLDFLMTVLRADLRMTFFNVFASVTLTLLIADFILGKPFTSCDIFLLKIMMFLISMNTIPYQFLKCKRKIPDFRILPVLIGAYYGL